MSVEEVKTEKRRIVSGEKRSILSRPVPMPRSNKRYLREGSSGSEARVKRERLDDSMGGILGSRNGEEDDEAFERTNGVATPLPKEEPSPWIVPSCIIVADAGWGPGNFKEQELRLKRMMGEFTASRHSRDDIGNDLEDVEVASDVGPAADVEIEEDQGKDQDEAKVDAVLMDTEDHEEDFSASNSPTEDPVVVDEYADTADVRRVVDTLIYKSESSGTLVVKKLIKKAKVTLEMLNSYLDGYPGILLPISPDGSAVSLTDSVKLVPSFELCLAHLKKGCTDRLCRKLHVCKTYALTHECEQKPCKFGHSLNNPHNRRVLQKVLEVTNVEMMFPKDFVMGLVTFCLVEVAELEEKELMDLEISAGVSSDGDADDISSSDSEDEVVDIEQDVDVLCMDFATAKCSAKKCPYVHAIKGKTYLWQAKEKNDDEWVGLSADHVVEIEEGFVDPKVDTVDLRGGIPSRSKLARLLGGSTWQADFTKMLLKSNTGEKLLLRRLEVLPDKKKHDEPKWQWYFLNEKNDWIVYGSKSSKTSADIENYFKSHLEKMGGDLLPVSPKAAAVNAHPFANIPLLKFSAGIQQYALDFAKMKQKNTLMRTERDVKRRPIPAKKG